MLSTSVKFGAIPQAEYTIPKANVQGSFHKVEVYELEPKDKPVLDQLEKRIQDKNLLPKDNGKNDKDTHYENLRCTIADAKGILRHRQDENISYADTSVVYMAVTDKKPCGLLIGNMPKLTQDGRITNTYRDKPISQETELDWLMTWPLGELPDRLKGIGKILLSQFYSFCNQLTPTPRTIYIRSELAENSVAPDFYQSMGCKQTEAGTIPWQTADGPVDVITHLYDPEYAPDPCPILPMEISLTKATQVAKERQQEFQYRPLKRASVPIDEIIDLKSI